MNYALNAFDYVLTAYLIIVVPQPSGPPLRWSSEFSSLAACRQVISERRVEAPNYGRGNMMFWHCGSAAVRSAMRGDRSLP
jgi:hypothetical protein